MRARQLSSGPQRALQQRDRFALWPQDLDLVRDLGLNTYRFSIEWARIEPEPGLYSIAMLDHYQRMIEGCRERGLTPMVTFNHFTCPRWFAATGGWLNEKSPDLFARYCERSARHLGASIGYATTLNEPNLMRLLKWFGLPPQIFETQRAVTYQLKHGLELSQALTRGARNHELAVMDEIRVERHEGAILRQAAEENDAAAHGREFDRKRLRLRHGARGDDYVRSSAGGEFHQLAARIATQSDKRGIDTPGQAEAFGVEVIDDDLARAGEP